MNNGIYLAFTSLLFAAYLIYFKMARKYNIVDVPNHRTMHEEATIRGGGIVIFLAMAFYVLLVRDPSLYFLVGLAVVGITGFLDDILDLSGKVRLPLQVTSIVLILAELNLLELNLLLVLLLIIVATGTLNAYNFMDGINGMTGGYSLIVVTSLIYVNIFVFSFISNDFLIFFSLAILVFNYFNFRAKAVCFAGDAGSLTIAYIVVFLIVKLITASHQFGFILFLVLYGVDTIFTIIQRIFRKENIFAAHRLHLFQVIVGKTRMSHLKMSVIYMLIQLIINIAVLAMINKSMVLQLIYAMTLLIVLSVVYIIIKRKMMIKAI